jgi:hypothetical protein
MMMFHIDDALKNYLMMCKSKNNQLDAQRKSVIIRLKP